MFRFAFFLLSLLFVFTANAQKEIVTVNASKKEAIFKLENGKITEWTVSPDIRQDIYDITVPRFSTNHVLFITDSDSIEFDMETNQIYDFVVLLGSDTAFTRVISHAEPATFSEQYKSTFNNKTIIAVPEVYELVNVVIALTNKGLNDSDLVNHETSYYTDVINYFGKYKTEEVVLIFDSILQNQWWKYFYLKMDAYAFEYKKGKITNYGVYDRVNWEFVNTLQPYMIQLEDFYRLTKFSEFYNAHEKYYNNQIAYMRDSLNIKGMQNWLNKNFPSTNYNCVKVIYSPLVNGSQSAIKFENNGFREAQVHVNFPYPDESDKKYSPTVNLLRNSMVIFTELNHSYINPEAEKYADNDDFIAAFKDLTIWEEENSAAEMSYRNSIKCFEEYLNWSLVSLYVTDNVPSDVQETLITNIEINTQDVRGFSKFRAFNRELIRLYKEKENEETIADLFPLIIKWCSLEAEK